MTIRVTCKLRDCAFHNVPADEPPNTDLCDCSHPEKPDYLKNETCPLYRMDWSSVDTSAAARFKRKLA